MNMEDVKCRACGCCRFWRIRELERMADFGREGTHAGKPYLDGFEKDYRPVRYQCAECGNYPSASTASEMEELIK